MDTEQKSSGLAAPDGASDQARASNNTSRFSAVRQRVHRRDSVPQVLGQLKYIDDLSFPGTLFAKVLRSQHPHARIVRIDTSGAEGMPGVAATLTAREIPVNSFGPSLKDQPVLAGEKVRHLGDGVAAVAAVSEQVAAEALSRIKVEYEPLPAVYDPVEAMGEGAPKVHDPNSNVCIRHRIQKGDVEKALAQAHLVVEERYTTQMVEHTHIEPHAAVAFWDAWGRLTVWATIGRISLARTDLARVLNLPINKVRVVSTQVGGNFGGKNEITFEPALALLARKTGRPVKGVYTRSDEFVSSTTRHPFVMDYTTGVTESGRILGRKVRIVADAGAYCSWSETTLAKATILSAGPYQVEHFVADAYAVYTNKTVTGAMRGFGAPQICFAYESHMDTIAHRLGLDPLRIRLLNALDEGSTGPTGQVLRSVAAKKALVAASERFGWKEGER
ncbi:MAG: molybdopterin cofactor-binding domain-containing protein [Thermodesulfobacteriota bacterium]